MKIFSSVIKKLNSYLEWNILSLGAADPFLSLLMHFILQVNL